MDDASLRVEILFRVLASVVAVGEGSRLLQGCVGLVFDLTWPSEDRSGVPDFEGTVTGVVGMLGVVVPF